MSASAVPSRVPKLDISHVSVSFGNESREVEVLRDVSLTVADGEFLTIIGPSGCGKSSLLNVITSIIRPRAGTVRLASAHDGRGRRLGYAFQKDTLLPWKTVAENIALPLRIQGRHDRRQVDDLIERVGLRGFGEYLPYQLSGGMRKRCQLAALLAQDPEVMLMDEPFGALDAQTKVVLQLEFLRLWEAERKTVLFVTHDLNEAILMSDRILVMSSRPGRILFSVDVNLPRPRSMELVVGSEEFRSLYQRLWHSLGPLAEAESHAAEDHPEGI